MAKPTLFDRMIQELQDDAEFLTEEMAFDCVNEICRLMKDTGVTAAELARRIGKSRAYVSRVLHCNPNMTIRSLVVLAHALGAKWEAPRLVPMRPEVQEAIGASDQVEAVAEEPPQSATG